MPILEYCQKNEILLTDTEAYTRNDNYPIHNSDKQTLSTLTKYTYMEPETLVGRCGEGQEFVRGYRKKDGEYVKGFCRKRHERVSRHDREVDRRNLQTQVLEEEQPQQHTSQMKEAKEQAKEERKAQHEAVVEEKRQEESIDQARERRAQDGKW